MSVANDASESIHGEDEMRKFLLGFCLGLLLPILGALIAAKLGFFSVYATEEPPPWEINLARMAVDASVARTAPRLSNPIASSDEGLLAGMHLYRNNCAGCHGDTDGPSPWGTRGFYPRIPQFAQSPPQKPDWQMLWIVRHGVRYSGMGAWQEEMLSDKEAWEVVTFLSRLNSLPPAVDAAWHSRHQP
jgi:mono/diheme cytochrome c family protein